MLCRPPIAASQVICNFSFYGWQGPLLPERNLGLTSTGWKLWTGSPEMVRHLESCYRRCFSRKLWLKKIIDIFILNQQVKYTQSGLTSGIDCVPVALEPLRVLDKKKGNFESYKSMTLCKCHRLFSAKTFIEIEQSCPRFKPRKTPSVESAQCRAHNQ